ncbi:chloride channel protein, partial [Pseudomonas sp. GW247-3R2A]
MTTPPTSTTKSRQLRDHSANWRMIILALAALPIGAGAACGAWILLKLIAIATNLFWFGRLSTVNLDPVDAR